MKIKRQYLLPLFVGIALFSVGLFLYAPSVSAATFTVNYTGDDSDGNPGDGICDAGEGACSLRAAIEETNALAGPDTIEFNIDEVGVQTITPGAELEIEDTLTIDGETQPGAGCNTLVPVTLPATDNQPHDLRIMIDPSGVTSGLIIRDGGDGSTVRGLVLSGGVDGITLDGAENVTIECNYIGANAAGDAVVTNTGTSILVGSDSHYVTIQNNLIVGSSGSAAISNYANEGTISENLIGSDASGTVVLGNDSSGVLAGNGATINRNVIVGSNGDGILNGIASSVVILGNYIGVGLDGSALGNGGDGIELFSNDMFQIGNVDSDERNVIAANSGHGIRIYDDCNGEDSVGGVIANNYVGTDTNGEVTDGYGNDGAGIEVMEVNGFCASVYRHQIGGIEDGQPNIIAGNGEQGVLIHQGATNDVFSISVIQNSIYQNGAFGIDLAANSGDNADQDLGPNGLNDFPISYPATRANNYLNHPEINSATPNGNQLVVNYDFDAPDITENAPELLREDVVGYRLEFYLNDQKVDGDYAGHTQGQTFLGAFVVDGSEDDATHTFTTNKEIEGKYLTATATILWQNRGGDDPCEVGRRWGIGPPYIESIGCVS